MWLTDPCLQWRLPANIRRGRTYETVKGSFKCKAVIKRELSKHTSRSQSVKLIFRCGLVVPRSPPTRFVDARLRFVQSRRTRDLAISARAGISTLPLLGVRRPLSPSILPRRATPALFLTFAGSQRRSPAVLNASPQSRPSPLGGQRCAAASAGRRRALQGASGEGAARTEATALSGAQNRGCAHARRASRRRWRRCVATAQLRL